jgi:hypothetical protein
MSERLHPVPETCQQALAAIEADPLDLPLEVQGHLRNCAHCSEARVQWLAQEEFPSVLVPADYFERLPERVMRKLPSRRRMGLHRHPWLWLAAAGLALALGVGGYLAGRVQQSPVLEASRPLDAAEILADTPFHESDDVMSQFSNLSPEDAEAVLKRLDASQPPRP